RACCADRTQLLMPLLSARTLARRRLFLFFQAEHGIRDKLVPGVQTCALPICSGWLLGEPSTFGQDGVARPGGRSPATVSRSEEPRVGRECRSRWARAH